MISAPSRDILSHVGTDWDFRVPIKSEREYLFHFSGNVRMMNCWVNLLKKVNNT